MRNKILNYIATIQIYIFLRKGVEVNISPNLPRDMPKLLGAYTTASNWLMANNVKITKI